MSAVTDEIRSRPATLRIPATAWLVAAATLLTLLVDAPLIRSVLAGNFSDPDDAMRIVEVRAWLGGQSWYDLSAHRLDPPVGASMHWSRLVDVPNAILIKLFGLVVQAGMAEALDRIVLPTLLLVGLYFAMARLARILAGPFAVLPALVGLFFSGSVLVLVQPGRIGHHGPEALALIVALGATLASLEARHARQAGIAGGLVALSLGMSLETMPFLAALGGSLVLLWIWRGAELAGALRWFAFGLLLGLPVVFLLTVGPDRWFAATCDAFGMAQFGAGLIAACGCLALATAAPESRMARGLTASGVGAAIVAFVALAYPACLHGPFAGVDPAVRAAWLDHVVESRPLLAFMRLQPALALAIVLPVALALVTSAVAAARTSGVTRLRFIVLAAMIAVGLGMGFWQVRVFTGVAPIAVCGGLPLVDLLRRRLSVGLMAALAVPAIFPFTSTCWAAILSNEPASMAPAAACRSAEALAPLATLSPGRVVATINEGSNLLVATPHAVFAAPYHRNNDGNRFVLDVFDAAPDQAKLLLEERHVDYVIVCPGTSETRRAPALAPAGLAARLEAGTVPSYLAEVRLPTPWRVYAVHAGAPSGAVSRDRP